MARRGVFVMALQGGGVSWFRSGVGVAFRAAVSHTVRVLLRVLGVR